MGEFCPVKKHHDPYVERNFDYYWTVRGDVIDFVKDVSLSRPFVSLGKERWPNKNEIQK